MQQGLTSAAACHEGADASLQHVLLGDDDEERVASWSGQLARQASERASSEQHGAGRCMPVASSAVLKQDHGQLAQLRAKRLTQPPVRAWTQSRGCCWRSVSVSRAFCKSTGR